MDLRAERKKQGISQAQLALVSGYSHGQIGDVERGRSPGSEAFWAAMQSALWGEENADLPLFTPPAFTELKKHEFKPGKKYEIKNGTRWEFPRVKLTFLRKEGIHHVFQSAAGWLATWTDAQLADVRVEEVGK